MRRANHDASAAATAPPARPGLAARVLAVVQRLHHLKTEHQFLGRYSIEKLHAFHAYQTSARWWRVALVLVATPLPTLLVLVLMDAAPLNDPRAGAAQNAVCFVRSVISHGVMTAMCLLPARQALRLNDSGKYPVWKVLLIGLLTCIAIESVWIPAAFLWRFPVPFRELLGVPLWCTVVVLLHCWLTPGVFARRPRRTRVYLVVVGTQIAILYGFLALSLGFAHVSTSAQVLLIALFPFAKIAAKRFVWAYARQLDDISTDVTVCMVEISGALYQTVCLQFATTTIIGVVILTTDLLQALVEVRAYLVTEYIVDGRATLATAMAILQSSVFPGADERPSMAHYSSTPSVASQADSASRRHSGTHSIGALSVRRRRRAPLVSSVFMQPKFIKQSTSKHRVLDLTRLDFDTLDGPGLNDASTPTGDAVPGQVNGEEAIAPDAGRDEFAVERLPPQPEPTLVGLEVGMMLEESDALAAPVDAEPSESRPDWVLQQFASVRRPSRATLHTDFSAHAFDHRHASSPQLAPPVVRKSILGAIPGEGGGAGGGLTKWAAEMSRRWTLRRQRSSSTRLTHPTTTTTEADPTPRPVQHAGSLARVFPEALAAAACTPPTPPVSARSTARYSSFPSMHRPSIAKPALEPIARQHSFDKRRRGSGNGSVSAVTIDGVRVVRKDQARILEQTLQLLFSCEVLLFVEYMEVVMPVLYALSVGGEWALPNGKYNLITMHLTASAVVSAVGGAVLYALLELLSLLVLNYVVWRKYGISAFHLLAFVLETYSLTLQGKLVGAFIVIVNTATLHQGVDFSFRFDYDALLAAAPPPR